MASLSFDLRLPRRPLQGSASVAAAPSPPRRHPPAVQPRQWQTRLIQLLRRRLERSGSHDVLINAGPGAGKTLGALLSFELLEREGRLQHLLVFCHRSSIASQWLAAASRLGLELQEWQPGGDIQVMGSSAQGLLITYQAAGRNLEQLEQQLQEVGWGPWLAIADEVHHLGMNPE